MGHQNIKSEYLSELLTFSEFVLVKDVEQSRSIFVFVFIKVKLQDVPALAMTRGSKRSVAIAIASRTPRKL